MVLHLRKGIALLITVMFVIVITATIGYILKQVNESQKEVVDERYIYESALYVEDILNILKTSPLLSEITGENGAQNLFLFLSENGLLSYEYGDAKVVIHIGSARTKFNLHNLNSMNEPYLRQYFSYHGVRDEYVDMLQDCIGGIREDQIYKSRIFEEERELFRDYLASKRHLEKINTFYKNEYADNALEALDTQELFSFNKDENSSIDLNYATPQTWELLTGVDQEQAKLLAHSGVVYTDINMIELSEDAKSRLQKFKISTFEPYLLVKIDIIRDDYSAHIQFEYDIANKREYNFVFNV